MKYLTFNRILGLLVSIVTIVGAIWTAGSIVDSHYAKAADIKLVVDDIASLHSSMQKMEERLDQSISNDQLARKQTRLWSLQDHFQGKKVPDAVQSEMHELQQDIDNLKQQQHNWETGRNK
jgi:hypothetical protein